jgi:hypothetical protein
MVFWGDVFLRITVNVSQIHIGNFWSYGLCEGGNDWLDREKMADKPTFESHCETRLFWWVVDGFAPIEFWVGCEMGIMVHRTLEIS